MRLLIIPYVPSNAPAGSGEEFRTNIDPLRRDGTIESIMTPTMMNYIIGYDARRDEYHLLKNRLNGRRGKLTPEQFRDFIREIEQCEHEIQSCVFSETLT